MKHLFIIFLSGLFLFSCTENTELSQTQPSGDTVMARLQLSVANMTPVGSGATTRSGDVANQAIEVSFDNASTRATEDKAAAEKTIKAAWLLQFNGTDAAATLIAKQPLTLDENGCADSPLIADCQTPNRLYVVANVDETTLNNLTANITLDAFEKTIFPQGVMTEADVTEKGLPMSTYRDMVVSAGSPIFFSLASRMAKLSFKYAAKVDNSALELTATLRNIPDRIISKETAGDANAQQPEGASYAATADLSAATSTAMTLYVPENLAGRNDAVTQEVQRSTANANANAMYVELTAIGEKDNTLTVASYVLYLGDWLTNKGDFNVKANTMYNVTATINSAIGTNDKRVENGGVYQNLSWDGVQPATANSYIVTAPGNYCIDATVMGNGKPFTTPANVMTGQTNGNDNFVGTDIIPSTLFPTSAKVLWETQNTTSAPAVGTIVSGVQVFKGKKLLFRATAQEGNALIAVTDGDNNILWSWHIWRTNTTPNTQGLADIVSTAGNFDTGTATISGMAIMDRNLGALSATSDYVGKPDATNLSIGLMYQWGRKDPFPGGADLGSATTFISVSGIQRTTAPGGKTPAEAVKNPTTFYTSISSPYDWTTRNDNLWGAPLTSTVAINSKTFNSNSGTKSIYDPCPIGWRVAPAYAFANVTKPIGADIKVAKGYSFAILTSGSSWFPASAFLNDEKGLLTAVGGYGSYWTSSPCATKANFGGLIDFDYNAAYPGNYDRRAYGNSIRCVLE